MDTEPGSLLQLVDRLGKLEGLIIGLQTSIGQSQTQTTAFMARVERLESRQVELERNMITKEDISSLVAKVDALATSEARQQGGSAVASWSVQAVGSWAAVIIALLALVGVGVNRERQQQQHQAPTPAGRPASP
jgi:ABC-type sugar transport system ATPase subunit